MQWHLPFIQYPFLLQYLEQRIAAKMQKSVMLGQVMFPLNPAGPFKIYAFSVQYKNEFKILI
jgi:hypothetical protein